MPAPPCLPQSIWPPLLQYHPSIDVLLADRATVSAQCYVFGRQAAGFSRKPPFTFYLFHIYSYTFCKYTLQFIQLESLFVDSNEFVIKYLVKIVTFSTTFYFNINIILQFIIYILI